MSSNTLSAIEARALIGRGELSPVELVSDCIDAIEALDNYVNAFITTDFESALKQARQLERARSQGAMLGPLHGLPVAIKDNQATKALRTTYGSAQFSTNIPDQDAPIVARIRDAGGIVIGKTNLPEYSIGANTVNRAFGATGNPFDIDKTCGGSSGGSAVALACQMVPLATGSDHGGSLRIPACFSGVVGYRATPGVVPNEGRAVVQTNYSVQGPMARTVADTALLLSVIAKRDRSSRLDPMVFPLEAESLASLAKMDISALRIGFSADLGGLLVSDTIRNTFADRVQRIARWSISLQPCEVDLRPAPEIDWRIRQELFVSQFQSSASSWDEQFNPNVQATYAAAMQTCMSDLAAAKRAQMQLYQDFTQIFDDLDIVVCPGVSISPFPWAQLNPKEIDGQQVDNYMAWLALTASLTVVGHPVVAIPCGLDHHGMPFGLQIVGPPHSDRRLLAIAMALESAFASDPVTSRPLAPVEQMRGQSSNCRAGQPN